MNPHYFLLFILYSNSIIQRTDISGIAGMIGVTGTKASVGNYVIAIT
jgi:hypothetical protein